MTEFLYSPKIKPEHLARKAIVYLRQSSEKQVRQNKESQRLQLDLPLYVVPDHHHGVVRLIRLRCHGDLP